MRKGKETFLSKLYPESPKCERVGRRAFTEASAHPGSDCTSPIFGPSEVAEREKVMGQGSLVWAPNRETKSYGCNFVTFRL